MTTKNEALALDAFDHMRRITVHYQNVQTNAYRLANDQRAVAIDFLHAMLAEAAVDATTCATTALNERAGAKSEP